MCFSKEVSLITFIIGLVGSIFVISLGTPSDLIVGYFLAFVSLMQFIEYLLWINQTCDQSNKLITHWGMILNHLQPIILGLLILIIGKDDDNFLKIILIMLFYTCVIIPYSEQFLQRPEMQCTLKDGSTSHLLWNWNEMNHSTFVYAVFLISLIALSIVGIPDKKIGLCMAFGGLVTFTTSLWIYPSNRSTGALWCFYTAFMPVIYYALRIYLR